MNLESCWKRISKNFCYCKEEKNGESIFIFLMFT